MIPPPPLEIAFCAFLLENEISADRGKIEVMLKDFVPLECFSHPFTVSFVEMWKKSAQSEEDVFSAWSEALSGEERCILDTVLAEQIKAQATTMEIVDEMKEFGDIYNSADFGRNISSGGAPRFQYRQERRLRQERELSLPSA